MRPAPLFREMTVRAVQLPGVELPLFEGRQGNVYVLQSIVYVEREAFSHAANLFLRQPLVC